MDNANRVFGAWCNAPIMVRVTDAISGEDFVDAALDRPHVLEGIRLQVLSEHSMNICHKNMHIHSSGTAVKSIIMRNKMPFALSCSLPQSTIFGGNHAIIIIFGRMHATSHKLPFLRSMKLVPWVLLL